MFSIENDIVYSIEYVDRSNWLVKKIPVMDKETFIKCFKEWITPGERTVVQGYWLPLGCDYYKCSCCDQRLETLNIELYRHCFACGSRNEVLYE